MSENIKEEILNEEVEKTEAECCRRRGCCETKEESLEDIIAKLQNELKE